MHMYICMRVDEDLYPIYSPAFPRSSVLYIHLVIRTTYTDSSVFVWFLFYSRTGRSGAGVPPARGSPRQHDSLLGISLLDRR